MPAVAFLPYHSSHKETLTSIFRLNVPQYFAAEEEPEFTDYLTRMGDTYLAVEYEGKIVGGAGYEFRQSDRSGRINWIFFQPDYSGLGLGKKTVAHCQAILRTHPEVEILIIRTSQLGYRFFEKCGYRVVETQKDYWAKGLDLYLMEQPVIHSEKQA